MTSFARLYPCIEKCIFRFLFVFCFSFVSKIFSSSPLELSGIPEIPSGNNFF
uniref:Uncharacterized protein n=1 Tax=Populus trichocarpa TaxID=3694 RepID=A9PIK6_POPTR|nr:unknown [Populus trichocarpa]